jgi:predicted negative regulator of RcsB-dependent stress response
MTNEAQSDLRITDQFDLETFWAEHGKKIGIAVLAILALGGVMLYRQNQASQRLEQAASSLATAYDPASLEQVAHEFAGTPAALEALSRLADLQYHEGKYADATRTFEQILKEFPSQPLAESARLGLAAIQEAEGNFEAAKASYAQIVGSNPTGYTVTSAKMGMARCSEALGQQKEARQLYEEVMVGDQRSPWSQEAYLRWMVIGRELPSTPATGTKSAAAPLTSQPPIPLGTPPAENVQP